MSIGQEDLNMAGGTQVIVPSNFNRAFVLSATKKSPTALQKEHLEGKVKNKPPKCKKKTCKTGEW